MSFDDHDEDDDDNGDDDDHDDGKHYQGHRHGNSKMGGNVYNCTGQGTLVDLFSFSVYSDLLPTFTFSQDSMLIAHKLLLR